MSSIFQKPPFNYVYKVGYENIVDFVGVNAQVTGVQSGITMQSVFAPNGTIVQDGQILLYRTYGNNAGASGRVFRVRINTIARFTTPSITPTAGSSWIIEALLFKPNSGVMTLVTQMQYNFPTGTAAAPVVLSASSTFTPIVGDITIDLNVDTTLVGEGINQTMSHLTVV